MIKQKLVDIENHENEPQLASSKRNILRVTNNEAKYCIHNVQFNKNLELLSAIYRFWQLLRLFCALQTFQELHNSVVQAIMNQFLNLSVKLSYYCHCRVFVEFRMTLYDQETKRLLRIYT